jgi:hypothetical protein
MNLPTEGAYDLALKYTNPVLSVISPVKPYTLAPVPLLLNTEPYGW